MFHKSILVLALPFVLICGAFTVSGCATSPPQPTTTVDVGFAHLLVPELAKNYDGKRVRTHGAFMTLTPAILLTGKYASGWMGAEMFAAKAGGDCEPAKGSAPGLHIRAPVSVGAVWADGKSGSIYEMVGTVSVSRAAVVLQVEQLTAAAAKCF